MISVPPTEILQERVVRLRSAIGLLVVLVGWFSFARDTCGQESVAAGATRILTNGTLTVSVMDPNADDRYYRGPRFSPVACVLAVEMAGKNFLFFDDEGDPEQDGAGLAMEFDILSPGGPPGFAEAAIGAGFVKVGVGVLRKADKHYRFGLPQEIIARAKTSVEWGKDRADFVQTCEGVNGYAYALKSSVELSGHGISIKHHLTNTGSKPFVTEEYAHNYFRFDGAEIGPAYEMQFPFDPAVDLVAPWIQPQPDRLGLSRMVTEPTNLAVPVPVAFQMANRVSVRNRDKAMRLDAEVSGQSKRTAIHAAPRYLCPEQFVEVNLAPGESSEWKRHYAFYDELD